MCTVSAVRHSEVEMMAVEEASSVVHHVVNEVEEDECVTV